MIIALDAENELDKIELPFMIKTLSTIEIAGSFLNSIKFFSFIDLIGQIVGVFHLK